MDHQGEIKRLRARIAELEIDAKAVQTGLLMRENLSELQAAKRRLGELEKEPRRPLFDIFRRT